MIKYSITKNILLNKKDIINLYHDYFIKLYGKDYFDAFLEVTNNNISNYTNKKDIVNNSSNYKRIDDILNCQDYFMYIYDDNNIIGCSRFNIKNSIGSIYELIIDKNNWEQSVKYLEDYFNKNKCLEINLYVPYYDGSLLVKSSKLGYKESFDNIDDKYYIVNKKIESK